MTTTGIYDPLGGHYVTIRGAVAGSGLGTLTSEVGSTIGTVTTVADNTTVQTILAANSARRSAWIFNDSTVTLYLLLSATGTVSSTVCSVTLAAGQTLVLENGEYTGVITGTWASNASGNARVTEFT